jgi:hypothetical protein
MGTAYANTLESHLVASYANQIKAHLANAPNSAEKNRLIKAYGLYVPGMENYLRGGK